jgi:hypothetical protein
MVEFRGPQSREDFGRCGEKNMSSPSKISARKLARVFRSWFSGRLEHHRFAMFLRDVFQFTLESFFTPLRNPHCENCGVVLKQGKTAGLNVSQWTRPEARGIEKSQYRKC